MRILRILVAALVLLGCGQKPQLVARQALDKTATSLKAVGLTIVDAYGNAKTADEFYALEDARMAWKVARETLLATEAALDLWEATGNVDSFASSAGDLYTALRRLISVCKDAGVPTPKTLDDVLALADQARRM